MKLEAIKVGMTVQWRDGMDNFFVGKVVSIEKAKGVEQPVVVELAGGYRKWVSVQDLTEKV